MNLSSILGVERNKVFGIRERHGEFKIIGDEKRERLYCSTNKTKWERVYDSVVLAIIEGAPDNIYEIHKRPTKEQVSQLSSIYNIGGKYLAKDKFGNTWAFVSIPVRYNLCWQVSTQDFFRILPSNPITELVDWTDDKPLDINTILYLSYSGDKLSDEDWHDIISGEENTNESN